MGGWREDRQERITIGVMVHPGGGQLDDSDREDTVTISLQSLLFIAVFHTFYTTEKPQCVKQMIQCLYTVVDSPVGYIDIYPQ